MRKEKFAFLLSPWAILAGMIAGVIIGIKFKDLALYLKPLGDIYLSILQMCVIPIMASAVVVSIAKLLKSHNESRYLTKILKVFIIFLFSASLISISVSLIARPLLTVSTATQKTIGSMMLQNANGGEEMEFGSIMKEIDSRYDSSLLEKEEKPGLIDFFINIVPKNIFTALTNGENLKIIFFFIVLGVLINFISEPAYNNIILLFEGCFEGFQKLINVSMYFLPFGLCALMADQFAQVGFTILISLIKLVMLVYVAAVAIFFVCTLVIGWAASNKYWRQFKVLGDVIIICLGARNSFAAIPAAITGLHKGLELNEDRINLSVPLGVTLCRYGDILMFSVGSIFATQLYGYHLDLQSLLIIIITSVLAAVASTGAPGIIAVTMISMILSPLGIPSAAIVVILIALDPVLDPILTLINFYPNCAAAALIASDKESTYGFELKRKNCKA